MKTIDYVSTAENCIGAIIDSLLIGDRSNDLDRATVQAVCEYLDCDSIGARIVCRATLISLRNGLSPQTMCGDGPAARRIIELLQSVADMLQLNVSIATASPYSPRILDLMRTNDFCADDVCRLLAYRFARLCPDDQAREYIAKLFLRQFRGRA